MLTRRIRSISPISCRATRYFDLEDSQARRVVMSMQYTRESLWRPTRPAQSSQWIAIAKLRTLILGTIRTGW
ncbi:hypothetical protein T440DRAFT_173560 [Plenodomus tracheiphilus IPT5]|uniref:Uncharacterized protein n=1 Tax=Plenodomus tracheiphilus IPT5 TaxID=1408161 RepID=A0A6A7AY96_9PLEO|nr:hypothetical protein T440DRAFT_173560 [Plenodomus tracheiphilus IPT5]